MSSTSQPDSSSNTEPNAEQPQEPPPLLPRTVHGSCHCQRLTYTAEIALPFRPEFPIALRCNCRICVKTGFTNVQPHGGREGFKLLTPQSLEGKLEAREGLGDYCNLDTTNMHDETKGKGGDGEGKDKEDKLKEKGSEIHRYFCRNCSVMICAEGRYFMPSQPQTQSTEPQEPKGNEENKAKGSADSDQRVGVESTSMDAEDAAPATLSKSEAKSKAEEEGGGEAKKEQAEPEGEIIHFFSINLGTLDQPQEGLDLSLFKMEYYDGRNDNWMGGRKDVPWSGGLV